MYLYVYFNRNEQADADEGIRNQTVNPGNGRSLYNTKGIAGVSIDDVLIDYKTQDFETIRRGYDAVLTSHDKPTLEKSHTV
ncbi:MDR/zinc-dependent alcohol dehydrogenase-like family protein [Spirosoma fluviale]|uniref:hypothetical protein n=1 Tax=Spirosoma fluviale TaxID=1597977 RepID=UPI000BE4098C|nr:hypothetical protein [Spirosoma fluviale]